MHDEDDYPNSTYKSKRCIWYRQVLNPSTNSLYIVEPEEQTDNEVSPWETRESGNAPHWNLIWIPLSPPPALASTRSRLHPLSPPLTPASTCSRHHSLTAVSRQRRTSCGARKTPSWPRSGSRASAATTWPACGLRKTLSQWPWTTRSPRAAPTTRSSRRRSPACSSASARTRRPRSSFHR